MTFRDLSPKINKNLFPELGNCFSSSFRCISVQQWQIRALTERERVVGDFWNLVQTMYQILRSASILRGFVLFVSSSCLPLILSRLGWFHTFGEQVKAQFAVICHNFWSRSRQDIIFLRSQSKRADSPAPTIIAKSPLQLWAIIPRAICGPDLRICVWNRSERCKSQVSASSSSCETMFARAASWLQIRLQHFYFSKIDPTQIILLLGGLHGI